MSLLSIVLGNWRLLAIAAAAAAIGLLLWRVDSLSESLEAEQAAHAAAAQAANDNAELVKALATEVERVNSVLVQREAELAASRAQLRQSRKVVNNAKGTDRDGPAAPVWGDFFDGLRRQ